jgi:hypothetical protein
MQHAPIPYGARGLEQAIVVDHSNEEVGEVVIVVQALGRGSTGYVELLWASFLECIGPAKRDGPRTLNVPGSLPIKPPDGGGKWQSQITQGRLAEAWRGSTCGEPVQQEDKVSTTGTRSLQLL